MKKFDFNNFLDDILLEARAQRCTAASLSWFTTMVHDCCAIDEEVDIWREHISHDHAFAADPRDCYHLRTYHEQVVVLYVWCSLLSAMGESGEAAYRMGELWKLIERDGEVELCRRDRAIFDEKMRVEDIRGGLQDILYYINHPQVEYRMLDWGAVDPMQEDRLYVSRQDGIQCYFEDGAPVLVKLFDPVGRLFFSPFDHGREPNYSGLPKDPSFEGELTTKDCWEGVASPIYHITKAQRILSSALRFVRFESKGVRKVIIAPNYKTNFDSPEEFAQMCEENGIELYQDRTLLREDGAIPYDVRYQQRWNKALDITEWMYRNFRSMDSEFIDAVIRDVYGDGAPTGEYTEEPRQLSLYL